MIIRKHADRSGIKLSGHWNISGVIHQIESLSALPKLESGLDKPVKIDCSEISSVDMSGLQLLHVWIQCLCLRGITPVLINLTVAMQRTIRHLGIEKCFSDFSADIAG